VTTRPKSVVRVLMGSAKILCRSSMSQRQPSDPGSIIFCVTWTGPPLPFIFSHFSYPWTPWTHITHPRVYYYRFNNTYTITMTITMTVTPRRSTSNSNLSQEEEEDAGLEQERALWDGMFCLARGDNGDGVVGRMVSTRDCCRRSPRRSLSSRTLVGGESIVETCRIFLGGILAPRSS
jgi:hypothetical protein